MMHSTKAEPEKKVQELLYKKDFSQAEKLIADILKSEPDNSDAFYLLGVSYYLQGKIAETIDKLKHCLQLDPKHTDAAICLSVLLNDIGRYQEAKRVFEQANQAVSHKQTGDDLNVDRKFAVKHLELADMYFRYKRYDEAIEEYSKACLLDPITLDIRIRRAKAFAKKGFITRAIQELQQLKADNPQFLPARIQLGLLHYSQGNKLDAELEWETILEMDPVHREAIAYLEMSKLDRKKKPN